MLDVVTDGPLAVELGVDIPQTAQHLLSCIAVRGAFEDEVGFDDDICPPAKAEIKDFHSRGQIPKTQKKNPWPLNARKLVYNNIFIIWT